jgi:hypothetical protein
MECEEPAITYKYETHKLLAALQELLSQKEVRDALEETNSRTVQPIIPNTKKVEISQIGSKVDT